MDTKTATESPLLSSNESNSDASWVPELLAPAGDWECARAAVENGADAIYFGLDRFNARMRAKNFTEADLPELMKFLHLRGVKGYVTFNTLVFTEEVDQAGEYLQTIIASGVDAAIVQDVGVCRMIRGISPDFPIHGSTQMTITTPAGVAFAREAGCSLVVLARECSIKDIEQIRKSIPAQFPLEVFVHGALCVAYSGQCLTSESLGGRSANRGECAQACRMPYELISDGKIVPLGDKRYLLSPQDLAGLDVLPEIIKSGVASLKIEGRLKSPEYVANITRTYREAIDNCALGKDSKNQDANYNLEMGFSRGLYSGWFRGINNQELVHARFGKKRGVYLGRVLGIARDKISVSLEAALKPGDGIVFDAGTPDKPEQGGRVYSVDTAKNGSLLGFGRGDLDLSLIHAGDRIWKTDDPELNRELRQTYAGDSPKFRRKISIEVHGAKGLPITAIARDELGNIARAESKTVLIDAEKLPLGNESLFTQFSRLGGTPFQLRHLENKLEGRVTLPISELNHLRRNLVDQLQEARRQPKRWTVSPSVLVKNYRIDEPNRETPELIPLVRNLVQLEALLSPELHTLYCEFEDPKKYREAVALFRHWKKDVNPTASIFVAPPRITKPGEEWILKQVRSSEADGYLVRNFDHLEFFKTDRKYGDFSLNVANPIAAHWFITNYRLERLTASYDLNISQLEALLKNCPPQWFEVTIHQHMPMFHMEHCVFCAFLSEGTDYKNCGRPCDDHVVKIRDRVGAEHPLKADAGCRNTVFNARAQTGAEFLPHLVNIGLRKIRLEFLNESPQECLETLASYRQLLRGEITGPDLWRKLKLQNQLGVTRGQLELSRQQ